MPLTPGTTLGPYTVTAQIGAGGMGEVYRARDTKLDRDVALKVLPEAFTADPDRLARFEREAKVLASLNHPNIGHIYGLEEAEGTKALVLELVEGPTLADRIAEGPIPVDEALPIAKQIAEALEAAHEQGVIHRDLKPANVKVKADGTVKVLDFGLAKAFQPEASGASASESPTISLTAAATQMGMVIGTAAYMSPEQAKGKVVDKRADVWAFGVVLYEVLTGRKPFSGDDVSTTLARVIEREPDWENLPGELSPVLATYLRRCLAKDPRQRVHDAADLRLAIEGAFDTTAVTPSEAVTQPSQFWQRPVAALSILVMAIVVTALAVWNLTRPGPPSAAPVSRFSLSLGADQSFTRVGRHLVALSPDGTRLVYEADGQLYRRDLDELLATAITAAADGARSPFISSDGEWIGFWAGGQLRKVAMSGGAAVTLCAAENPMGASWGDDETILFGQGENGIWRVLGTGGTPEVIITVAEGEVAHGPQMLPNGEWVLYTLGAGIGSWNEAQVVVQSTVTGERTVVIERGRDARYISTGHLVYLLDGVLHAAPFDVDARVVTGGPVPLVEGVADSFATGAAHFDLASTGALVYVPRTGGVGGVGRGSGSSSLVWVSRQGEVTSAIPDWDTYGYPRLSPDATRVAAALSDADNTDLGDIWIRDLEDGFDIRVTESGLNVMPVWTPDGTSVTFSSGVRPTQADLYSRPVDLSDEVVLLVTSSGVKVPGGWSGDGQTLVYYDADGDDIDLWMLRLGGEPVPFLSTSFIERAPRLSPDGKWLAYVSNRTGEARVFVQPFPDGGEVIPISTGPGTEPVWARDGEELFFRNGNQLLAVEIAADPTFNAGRPRVLFEGPYATDPLQVWTPTLSLPGLGGHPTRRENAPGGVHGPTETTTIHGGVQTGSGPAVQAG